MPRPPSAASRFPLPRGNKPSSHRRKQPSSTSRFFRAASSVGSGLLHYHLYNRFVPQHIDPYVNVWRYGSNQADYTLPIIYESLRHVANHDRNFPLVPLPSGLI